MFKYYVAFESAGLCVKKFKTADKMRNYFEEEVFFWEYICRELPMKTVYKSPISELRMNSLGDIVAYAMSEAEMRHVLHIAQKQQNDI